MRIETHASSKWKSSFSSTDSWNAWTLALTRPSIRVSQVGYHFYLKPALWREVPEKASAKVLYFRPCHVSLWGFMDQLLRPRTSNESSIAFDELPSLSWMNTKYKTDRAMRSLASTRGTLMCTSESKCWGSLFSGHHRRANRQESGKQASSWDRLHIPPRAVVTWAPWSKQSSWHVAVAWRGLGAPLVRFRVNYFGIIRQV